MSGAQVAQGAALKAETGACSRELERREAPLGLGLGDRRIAESLGLQTRDDLVAGALAFEKYLNMLWEVHESIKQSKAMSDEKVPKLVHWK